MVIYYYTNTFYSRHKKQINNFKLAVISIMNRLYILKIIIKYYYF